MRSTIYQCGNYSEGCWVKLGEIQGYVFPSKRESEYYLLYKDMLERGEIVKLELQLVTQEAGCEI